MQNNINYKLTQMSVECMQLKKQQPESSTDPEMQP